MIAPILEGVLAFMSTRSPEAVNLCWILAESFLSTT